MPIHYVYLDDEPPAKVQPYINAIVFRGADIAIEHLPPEPYQQQIAALEEKAFDGLILDLRLDQVPNWRVDVNGETADYRASTLAQEIRTRAAEKREREYPIVLWSTDQRLKTSYVRDDTSHDLFDLTCVKQEILDPLAAADIGKKLHSLVIGYRRIIEIRNQIGTKSGQFYRFLGFEAPPDFLDEQLLEYFDRTRVIRPAHEYARFLLREVIGTPGPLVDQPTLAARLGLDVDRSGDFERLLSEVFGPAAYRGPFGDGWPRWWETLVDDVWQRLEAPPGPLRSIPAGQRVEHLRACTGLKDLVPADPLVVSYSQRFWTICQGTGRPLDPRDGFVLDVPRRFPWQGDSYVSLEAYRNRSMQRKGLRIAPRDRSRFERAKQQLRQ